MELCSLQLFVKISISDNLISSMKILIHHNKSILMESRQVRMQNIIVILVSLTTKFLNIRFIRSLHLRHLHHLKNCKLRKLEV